MPLIQDVAKTLKPENGPKTERKQRFDDFRLELSAEQELISGESFYGQPVSAKSGGLPEK
jgi:hypothetical protein